ncbi:MAG: crosslink repair DNA glycosylase YcaQ family protein [Lacunisphaera sp.]
MPAAISVSAVTARRFMLRALLLDSPAASVGVALRHHGYIQIDPINVTGRMHDLILRNRVVGYREGDLLCHLHGRNPPLTAEQRTAFEHHLPSTGILVAFPIGAWPYLLTANAARSRQTGAWSGRLTPNERELAKHVLREITARGPLRSAQFEDERRSSRKVWGTMRLVKSTMQKLFFHGQLLIAGRTSDNHRLYDLPQRVLPPAVLAAKPPPAGETDRWLTLTTLRQRRLVLLKKKELPLVEDLVQAIKIEGCPLLHCLREDVRLFDSAGPTHEISSTVRLLAPLDPLIYDRRVTSALWNFDYTWEVYTPPAKRVRGYYALPILSGTEIVGHVDPKAHRSIGRLKIVSRSVRRGHQVKDAVHSLAHWLGLKP